MMKLSQSEGHAVTAAFEVLARGYLAQAQDPYATPDEVRVDLARHCELKRAVERIAAVGELDPPEDVKAVMVDALPELAEMGSPELTQGAGTFLARLG